MKRILIIATLSLALILTGCASKWHAAYGVAAWTNKNMESLQGWYDKGSDEEKTFLRANINPPMNIMKHACLAIDAIEKDDDIALGKEILIITEIGIKWGKSFPSLLEALKRKDVEKAVDHMAGIQLYIQEQAGIVQVEEKPGIIRRFWNWLW